jgi:hypothetical protein
VFWDFPIIPCLKRWFANKESELLRWHKEKHKQDARMIRHPTDATQWRNINSRNPEFAINPRNIRIAMRTNVMNPFMYSNTYSTWPIMLMILNLSPWLCDKQKNMCESLFGTLLNTDGKTRDHGQARANPKKMGIRQELWPDDLVKGTELPTSCITL